MCWVSTLLALSPGQFPSTRPDHSALFVQSYIAFALAGASHSLQHNLTTIVDALGQTEVGDILCRVSEENVPDFYKWYLHDFVRYVHQSGNKSDLGIIEYKVCIACVCVCVHVCLCVCMPMCK